jgi:Uma2 family endonuclease
MALAREDVQPDRLTYEEYLAEDMTRRRYEILDGERFFMTNPTRRHQKILLNLGELFRAYQRAYGSGETLIAPQDVLIRRAPLRVRQPDVLFISHERLRQCAGPDDPTPLSVAPELVVEILSPSERRRARQDRIRDYCAAGALERWVVSPVEQSVEVLRLSPQGPEPVALYGAGDTVRSAVFQDLSVPVEAILAE